MSEPRTFRMNNELPVLHIPWPECGHCGKTVEIDGGCAWCEGCRVQWGRIAEEVAVPDPNAEGTDIPCAIVSGTQDAPHDGRDGRHFVPGPPLPCILPSGHEGDHLCPYEVEVFAAEADR